MIFIGVQRNQFQMNSQSQEATWSQRTALWIQAMPIINPTEDHKQALSFFYQGTDTLVFKASEYCRINNIWQQDGCFEDSRGNDPKTTI